MSGTTGTRAGHPDPAGDAAGAILVAWRDTVLAPVVEELSATRRELGQVRQELGRLEAERDQERGSVTRCGRGDRVTGSRSGKAA